MATSAHNADVSLETFSPVVEAIYDCAIDPNGWHETVRVIARLCESQRSALGVHDCTTDRSDMIFRGLRGSNHSRLHEESTRG